MIVKYDNLEFAINLDNFDSISCRRYSETDENFAKKFNNYQNKKDYYVYSVVATRSQADFKVGGTYTSVDEVSYTLFSVAYQYESDKKAEDKAKETYKKVYDSLIKAWANGEKVVTLPFRRCYCFKESTSYYNSNIVIKSV